MARSDLDAHFQRVEKMVQEINEFVPDGTHGAIEFRADLAGLLIVAMAASYESCVKETIVNHASNKHIDFEKFAENNFSKLSSRVTVNDLMRYAGLFDESIKSKFKDTLAERRKSISGRTGKSIEKRYAQILEWRHAFAHAGIRNTTISEAVEFHRYAKRVLYVFDDAFSSEGG